MKQALARRDFLRLAATGALGVSYSGWLPALAAQEAGNPQRRRACILLWMNGGPSQTDTFDLKPGHANGGPYREIQTNVPGIRISEHLPQLAQKMNHLSLIRAMSSREGDHGRGTYLMHTGFLPQGPIQYPTLGSLISKELGREDHPLPNFVSIAPYRVFNQAAYAPGFLGPAYAPLLVGDMTNPGAVRQDAYDQALQVPDMAVPASVGREAFDARVALLQQMERDFTARHPGAAPQSHRTAYDRAVRLMRTAAREAFDLSSETAALRDRYGRNIFGQGCLMARRLVERGVPFVEVTLGALGGGIPGWDTHARNFDTVRTLSQTLDPAFATLIDDLRDKGLLDTTTIVWMGEFGRTPRINGNQGRDHFPNAWTAVLAGGGIRGGSVYGRTTADGMEVDAGHARAVRVPDFIATVCRALGIDHTRSNMSNVGRPIRLADHGAQPLRDILAG